MPQKSTRVLLILLSIILTGSISYAGIRIWEKSKVVGQEKASISQTQKESEPNEIDTSDWKTYRNEEYGFELRYPKTYQVEEESNKIITLQAELKNSSPQWSAISTISIEVRKNTEDLNLYELINRQENPPYFYIFKNKKYIEIDGIKTFSAEISNWGMSAATQYIFIHNSDIYYITDDNYADKEQNILSTFKFID